MVNIELKNISKTFGPVKANQNINIQAKGGEILGLLGENGAGKTTLMNILSGLYQPDSGDIIINGRKSVFNSPGEAISAGVGMVHQHFMLVDNFSVLENVVLGTETGFSLNKSLEASKYELHRLEKEYHLEVDINSVINTLPVGLQQRVEILKALYRGADILICLLYTSPSPRDGLLSRMPSSA